MREHPDGHIVVSKEEQDEFVAGKTPQQVPKNLPSQLPAQFPLKEDVKVELTARSNLESESNISEIPSPKQENHNIEVENLRWQIEADRKLNLELKAILEDKVTNLMAVQDDLHKQITLLKSLNSDKETVIEELNTQIKSRDQDIFK